MRTPLIAGNWKLHKTSAETKELIKGIIEKTGDVSGVDIVVAPSFTSLPAASEAVSGSSISLAAQNVFWEEKGAFTGEISAAMLTDAGCRYVIIGHSERRQFFGETNETVNKKINAAIAQRLKPIVCVGETLDEREADKTTSVIETQLKGGFEGIGKDSFAVISIAYEPIWAIGTGKTATNEQAQEVHAFIRGWLKSNYGNETAEKTRILYGGSVKPSNAAELMSQPDVDGALVGGASLNAQDFSDIIRLSVNN